MKKTAIAIFVSGRGSNAKSIINYASDANYEVALLFSSKQQVEVLDYAIEKGIKTEVLSKENFSTNNRILEVLASYNIELLVLAGFLWLVPSYLVKAFDKRILNIHPSLLPKFGGKGMYGVKVHQAVADAGEHETGITIHLVNEQYDEGEFLFQKAVQIEAKEHPNSIASKVLEMEHHFYPRVIEKYISEVVQ